MLGCQRCLRDCTRQSRGSRTTFSDTSMCPVLQTPSFQPLTFQADTGRISNKLRRGSRLVERRSFVKPSVIGHVRVSCRFLLGTAMNVRNEVAVWFRRPWAVAIGFSAYQQFGSQVVEHTFPLCVLARPQSGHRCQVLAGHRLSRSTVASHLISDEGNVVPCRAVSSCSSHLTMT